MSMKLLIADDEDTIRNGIAKYIKLHTDRFSQIYLAENGQQALDIILKYQPDLMLLDVQMPLKTGLEVLQEAQKLSLVPGTIILSGYDDFEYARKALRYGVKDYLLKPCRSSEILEAINKLVQEQLGAKNEVEGEGGTGIHYIVSTAIEYMEEYYHKNLTLIEVSNKVGITAGYLSTLFTQNMNCGFVEYLNKIRIKHACSYLEQNYFKTYEIAYKVGFKDEKYFSKVFKKETGNTPYEYRREHCAGKSIRTHK